MDVPPSRYKVVERGRRLVVLDRWNGDAPVNGPQPMPGDPARRTTVEQASAALHPERPVRPASPTATSSMDVPPVTFTTQRWFDDKAPRRVRIRAEDQSKVVLAVIIGLPVLIIIVVMIGWPVLLVIGFTLFQPRIRKSARAALTRAFDDREDAG